MVSVYMIDDNLLNSYNGESAVKDGAVRRPSEMSRHNRCKPSIKTSPQIVQKGRNNLRNRWNHTKMKIQYLPRPKNPMSYMVQRRQRIYLGDFGIKKAELQQSPIHNNLIRKYPEKHLSWKVLFSWTHFLRSNYKCHVRCLCTYIVPICISPFRIK